MKSYFVAGTDTEIGKTTVSEQLLTAAANLGLQSYGLKPLAAGAELVAGEWRNDDALRLQSAASLALPYDMVNPVLLREPMAPHIAAEREQRRLSSEQLAGFVRGTLMTNRADFVLIEGAGGWRVPLNQRESLAELPKKLNVPVLLVVGMKLGCLNHAMLTAEAIRRDGLTLAGWFANCVDPDMTGLKENIQTLEYTLGSPLLGVLPFMADGERAPENWLDPAFLPAILPTE